MLGYLLVDHGSRREASNRQLEDMAGRVRGLRPGRPVTHAHMEIAPPTIADGFARLVAEGATRIQVLLYFLGDGRHSSEDIPRLAREAAAAHPGLAFSVSPPLGPHDLLAQLLLLRAGEAAND